MVRRWVSEEESDRSTRDIVRESGRSRMQSCGVGSRREEGGREDSKQTQEEKGASVVVLSGSGVEEEEVDQGGDDDGEGEEEAGAGGPAQRCKQACLPAWFDIERLIICTAKSERMARSALALTTSLTLCLSLSPSRCAAVIL